MKRDKSCNHIVLDLTHAILKESFPQPDPSFAFHQFSKSNIKEKERANESNNSTNKENGSGLNKQIIVHNCCCTCHCSFCALKKHQRNGGNSKVSLSSHLSCDRVDLTCMNLSFVDYDDIFSLSKDTVKAPPMNRKFKNEKESNNENSHNETSSTSINNEQQRICPLACKCRLRNNTDQVKEIKSIYGGNNRFSSIHVFAGRKKFPKLQELCLPGNKISRLHLKSNHTADEQSNDFSSLRILDLSHNLLFDNQQDYNIESLYNFFNDLALFHMPYIEELNVSFNRHITKNSSQLHNINTSLQSVIHIRSNVFPSLQKIQLDGNNITDSHRIFSLLSQMCPSLTEISLVDNHITFFPRECLHIDLLPSTECEDDCKPQYDPNGEQQTMMLPFSNLKTMNLARNRIESVESMLPIVLIENLNRLVLSGNPITIRNNFKHNPSSPNRNNINHYTYRKTINKGNIHLSEINNRHREMVQTKIKRAALEARNGMRNIPLEVIMSDDYSSSVPGKGRHPLSVNALLGKGDKLCTRRKNETIISPRTAYAGIDLNKIIVNAKKYHAKKSISKT